MAGHGRRGARQVPIHLGGRAPLPGRARAQARAGEEGQAGGAHGRRWPRLARHARPLDAAPWALGCLRGAHRFQLWRVLHDKLEPDLLCRRASSATCRGQVPPHDAARDKLGQQELEPGLGRNGSGARLLPAHLAPGFHRCRLSRGGCVHAAGASAAPHEPLGRDCFVQPGKRQLWFGTIRVQVQLPRHHGEVRRSRQRLWQHSWHCGVVGRATIGSVGPAACWQLGCCAPDRSGSELPRLGQLLVACDGDTHRVDRCTSQHQAQAELGAKL
mmetsp:Transcript_65556/g.174626  ORF Transcript_65556/g.174626 Transcript_65556/m.174626 type:complete len:272 (-) Transcript_65556:112-927(-)